MRSEALGPLSVQELVQRLIGSLSALADKQMELAKAEARQEVQRRGLAVGLLVGGLIFLFLALVSIMVSIILALSAVVPGWLAGLIVALVLAIVGGILAWLGYSRVREPLMNRTVQTLRENIEWAKTLSNSNGR